MKQNTIYLLLVCLLLVVLKVQAQQDSQTDSTGSTIAERDFKKLDLFPAISYAPETKLTLGVIGYYYLDFYRGDPRTQISNINFLAIYTLNNQIAIESRWELFTNGNRWRFRGEAVFNRWPDRNYGRGNAAGALLAEIEEVGNTPDTLNYLNISYNRINFMPAALWRVSPNLYIGPRFELENLSRFSILSEKVTFLNAESSGITEIPMEGWRSGLGLQLLLDTRDYILNPIRGTFIEASTQHFFRWLGSDYVYHNFQLDARRYINTVLNHTLALRGLLNFRFSDEPIPFRGLSRVGGRELVRGYFKGTYQDNHMLAFELEYRLPFWREDSESGFWQLWKRLGVAAFLSGAQVRPEVGDFRFNQFRLAAGAGLRILFNQESRVNLRIDYAIGLAPNSDGTGERQTGLYFFLAEAF